MQGIGMMRAIRRGDARLDGDAGSRPLGQGMWEADARTVERTGRRNSDERGRLWSVSDPGIERGLVAKEGLFGTSNPMSTQYSRRGSAIQCSLE